MLACLEMRIQQKDWSGATREAVNLSGLWLTLGDVAKAVAEDRRCVQFAADSGDAFLKTVNPAALADALHQAGELAEAEALFREAEAIQEKNRPEYPWLYALQGFSYCDLLLAQGQAEAVLERATQTLVLAQQHLGLLDIALDHLSPGRARWALAEAGGEDNRAEAATHLDAAVTGLRKAGQQHFLPRGLLARAGFRRFVGDYAGAALDLSEAMELATRCGMRLFETDAHLEYARLYTAMAEAGETEVPPNFEPGGTGTGEALRTRARKHLSGAETLIAETGYHRRDPEAEALRQAYP